MAVASRARILVTVKAQPALSQRHGEVVCVAGLRLDDGAPRWIRLFPVGFRDLERVQKFKKYQLMEVDVRRARSDARPESFTPDMTSAVLGDVVPTGSDGLWRSRWAYLELLAGTWTMCGLNRAQRLDNAPVASLAMIRPRIVRDVRVIDTPGFSEAQQLLAKVAAEADLFGDAREPLEPSPFTVVYDYLCDEVDCMGHSQTCVDWEVGAAGRAWLRRRPREQVRAQLRRKWLDELCAPDRDTWFFVGNQHLHPRSYLVLGVYWPRRPPPGATEQLELALL
jgi:hypothetical protein